MTDDERAADAQDGSDQTQRPWWYGGAEGMPDVESLLGPDGMEAVGGVAEEALKLFVVLRDRVNESGLAAPSAAPAGGWGVVMGQLAAGAVRAVNEFAASAGQSGGPAAQGGPWQAAAAAAQAGQQHAESAHTVLPGQAAACAYCPICQMIALFRSVPMSTWQRLAASVVDAADAARDPAEADQVAPVVVTPQETADGDPVEDFLRDLDLP